jgi:nitroreductase
MEFFEAVEKRRSVRVYKKTPVPPEVVNKALDAALLAPNSSNVQTWEFHWVRTAALKSALIEACLSQSAARTAAELVVVVADASLWRRNTAAVLEHLPKESVPAGTPDYYKRLVPFLYGWRALAPLKWLIFNIVGLFRPMVRGPVDGRDVDEVAVKSAALAAQNFMLAISAQGFDTCPMEGFDEARVKKMLGLSRRARVVMVVAAGEREPRRGVWGERYRVPRDWVVKER